MPGIQCRGAPLPSSCAAGEGAASDRARADRARRRGGELIRRGDAALRRAGRAISWCIRMQSGVIDTIVWQLRLPRVCIAATVGASLALCGALLQGMLRNPLADPYLTGVSAAAAAAIAIAVLAGVGAGATPAIGFVAGLGAALLVAALARRGSGIDSNRLILAGVSLSTLFAAIVTLAVVRAQSSDMRARFSPGSPARWPDAAGTIWRRRTVRRIRRAARRRVDSPLNALRIGDCARAPSAWTSIARSGSFSPRRRCLPQAASCSPGSSVSSDLIVPHFARRIVGSDARALLPACAAIGAALCMLADAICRAHRRTRRTSDRRVARVHRRPGVSLSLPSSDRGEPKRRR